MIDRLALARAARDLHRSPLDANAVLLALGVEPEATLGFLADLVRGALAGGEDREESHALVVLKTSIVAFEIGVVVGREAAHSEPDVP